MTAPLDILEGPAGDVPEADRFGEAPHPREMLSLLGHEAAESEFLEAFRARRLHHAWLIAGEEGIGKATLAYRIARFLLAGGRGEGLAVPASHPVATQIAAAAHPDLAVIRRAYDPQRKAVTTEIRVDDVRKGLDVFAKTAGAGGYRIAIIDACDDLNASSANALLKTLEEPPAQSLFLLVTHQPRRLLPTIRSRCRMLHLRPLPEATVATITRALPGYAETGEDIHRRAAALSEGSVRRALAVLDPKKLAFHDSLAGVLAGLPVLDDDRVDALAEETAGRTGEEAFEHFCSLCRRWLSERLAASDDPRRLLPVAETWQRLATEAREVDIYNLDRRPLVIGLLNDMARLARAASRFG